MKLNLDDIKFLGLSEKPDLDDSDLDDLIPEYRISTYEEAMAEYCRAVESHIPSMKVLSAIDKVFGGLPPYNPKRLAELGQTPTANFNDNTARAILQEAVSAHYNLFYESEFLADIDIIDCPELREQLEIPEPQTPEERDIKIDSLTDWARIATEQWTYSKRIEWGECFTSMIASHLEDYYKYGFNVFFWNNPENPIAKAGSRYSHYMPADQSVCVDENDIHVVKHSLSIFELLEYYKSEKAVFWNKDPLRKVIVRSLIEDDEEPETNEVDRVEQIIKQVKAHQVCATSYYNQKVELVTILVKEYPKSGEKSRITRLTFAPYINTQGVGNEEDGGDLLFFHSEKNKTLKDYVIYGTLLPNVSEVPQAKGIGHIGYQGLAELNRQKSSLYTTLKLSRTLGLKMGGSDSVTDGRMKTLAVGGVIKLKSDESLEATKIAGITNSDMAAIDYLERSIAKSLSFITNPGTPSDANLPASVANQKAIENSEQRRINVNHYLMTVLDPLFENILAKEIKYQNKDNLGARHAKSWIDRCVKEGVPKELFEAKHLDEKTGLPKWIRIRAFRRNGLGTLVGNVAQLRTAYEFQIPQRLKGKEKEEFDRYEKQAIFGSALAKQFSQPRGRKSGMQYKDHTIAGLVANDLEDGKRLPPFSEEWDMEAFAEVLVRRMQEVIGEYEQVPKLNAEDTKQEERELLFKTDIALQGLVKWSAMVMTFLQEDPSKRESFRELYPIYKSSEGTAAGIHKNANLSRAAQAREQAELAQTNSIAERKMIAEMELKRLTAVLTAQNDRIATQLEIQGKVQSNLRVATIERVLQARLRAQRDQLNAIENIKKIDLERAQATEGTSLLPLPTE